MAQATHVLVGGGTGFIGRHLVDCLRKIGAKVQIITRSPAKRSDCISWDNIGEYGLPKGTTAVVNLAGLNILAPSLWTQSFKKEVYNSRIDTNRLLVNAIHKASPQPRAFVTISGVGYYEPSDSHEYDENWIQPDDKAIRENYLMHLAHDWEKSSELIEQLAPATRRVVIRAGAVLGRDGGVIGNLKLPFSLGLGGPLGDGSQWMPWIHVEDLANMFKFAITNDHVIGVINGVAPEQVRNKDFVNAFGRALNRPVIFPTPAFVIKMIFGNERADVLLAGIRVKSRAGQLGFRYQYPTLLEACKESVCRN